MEATTTRDPAGRAEASSLRPALPSWPHWWPLLFGPCVIVTVYIARAGGYLEVFGRSVQDDSPLPYVLTLTAFAIAAARAFVTRNTLMGLIAIMALAVFNREVHWEIPLEGGDAFSPTTTMAYLTLAGVLAFGYLRYERVGPWLCRGRVAQWLIIAAATYVLAVAVGKGWIKFMLPDDRAIRNYLEETCENAAHITLIVTTLTGWRKPREPERKSEA